MLPRRGPAVALLLLLAVVALPASAVAAADSWSWPVGRDGLDRRFDPPASEYGAGHRGIDVVAAAGTPVRAVAAGRVTFAGSVAGIDTITVDHGDEQSTYQPVRARVTKGDAVDRGQVIGTLLAAPSHCATACLHLGRKADEEYLDPLDLLGGGRFRLVSPDGPPPTPPVGGVRPVEGPITSAFGMRVHPITGQRKLHDGVDIAAPCGTPVRSVGAGRVVSARSDGGYGNRVVVEHPDGSRTGYAHLSRTSVQPGDRVGRREVIGHVGSTGYSTGCHLHLMLIEDGRPVDPMRLL